jgi:hypothetical protein
MVTIITSQEHLDDATVAEKRAARDYECLVSPEFDVDGETYQVLLDGHHRFAAAMADGAEPELIVATAQQHDAVTMLLEGRIEEFLQAVHHGHDYRDAKSGRFVW